MIGIGRWMAGAWALIGVAAIASGDVVGTYDGEIAGKKLLEPVGAAGTLSQFGKAVSGTVAIDGDAATVGGAYLVTGKATARRVKVKGLNASGAKLKWRGKILEGVLEGKARIKAPGVKIRGRMALVRQVSTDDGSGCDGVFEANETLFTDQVLGQALTSCTACHVAGGQAGNTRLHVEGTDPLAVARTIAQLVDPMNPPASRILAKPMDLVPHGGGLQLEPTSAEAGVLTAWVDLLVAAGCR